jgi:hypothetical protein
MRLKKFFLALIIILNFYSNLFGQNSSNQEKIIAIYGQEWYDRELSVNKPMIDLLNEYIKNGFTIQSVSEGKFNEFVPISFIPLVSKNNDSISVEQFLLDAQTQDFNPLKYRFFPNNENQVFKLAGENKIIYIKSIYLLTSKAHD